MTASTVPIVVDASVAIALVLSERETPAVRASLRRWVESGADLLVPSYFWLEVVNVLGRTHGLPAHAVLEAVHELDDLGLTSVDLDRALTVLTIGRVEQTGLTAYDAAYLALAEASAGWLTTLDRALAVAAGPRFIDPTAPGGHRVSETPAAYGSEGTWPQFRGAAAYLAKLRAEARERHAPRA